MKSTIYNPLIIRSNRSFTRPQHRLTRLLVLLTVVWMSSFFSARAQIQVPVIPSNTQLSREFEYNTEYVFRVNLDGSWLEDGTIVAYINGQLRGAQSASELFSPTGQYLYKVRVFSDNPSGDTITFRYYDVFNEKVYDIVEYELFTADNVPDYYSPIVLNAVCGKPGVATGLLPADLSAGQSSNPEFFWQPADNTLKYNLYLWKDGDSQPASPYKSNITGTSVHVYNLEYGQAYHWFVMSLNQCLQDTSITQTFTVRDLPDLVMTNMASADTVYTSTDFNLSYTVTNSGPGATPGNVWYDAFYLSQDNSLSGDDRLLKQVVRKNALEADSSYLQTITLNIPTGYIGDFYIIGVTDRSNAISETDNANNAISQPAGIHILEKPLPDITVNTITTGNFNFRPGDSIDVSWKVENIGDATAQGGWTEKVSLVSLSGIRVYLQGASKYDDSLAVNGSTDRSGQFVLPRVMNFSGEAYVEVEIVPTGELIEYPGATQNNKAASQNRVTVGTMMYLDIPSTVAENYSGDLRCSVTRSGNYSKALTVNLSALIPGQLNVPSSITIPERSSSAVFNIGVIDNDSLDGDRQIGIRAVASGYEDVSGDLEILDNEIPSLSLSFDNSSATEGDTLHLTISRDLVSSDSVMVYLSTDASSQWSFPDIVEIPGGEKSVIVDVAVTDNSIPELNSEVSLTARSEGMSPGSAVATIIDDDIPELTFEILTDTVSEGAGPYATWGIIRRIGDPGNAIRVNLVANLPNELYFPASLTMDKGVVEKKFNIGAIDNALVDGYRTVELSCQIYISSCNCNTTPQNGGVVTDKITIIDNDGPSLSVSIHPASLKEGVKGAGTMTIFRNTPPDQALTVTLSANDTTEVSIPPTAQIPAGKSTVDVPVDTKDDHIDDGSQMVTLQAKAPGFSPGMAWVDVTDINRPDLELSDIELASDTLITGRQVKIQTMIQNNGYGNAPIGLKVWFYLSRDNKIDDHDSLVCESTVSEPIPIGGSYTLLDLFLVPRITGEYYLLGKVNPEAKITELLYVNNESSPHEVTIRPNYYGTANVDESAFKEPQPVTIHGQANMLNGDPAPGVDLDVYVMSGNFRKVLKVTTDDKGNYTTRYEPYNYEAGHYIVGACYPGEDANKEQDAFDIMGMKRSDAGYLTWNIKKDTEVTGTIGIKNRSSVPLTGITFEPLALPDGAEFSIDTISNLPGNGTAEFNYTLKGTVVTQTKSYLEVPVKVTSAEGISLEFTAYYYCQALGSHLVSLPTSINTSITKDKTRYYDIKIINDGAGETGKVSIELPPQDWFTLASVDTVDNMASGDTITATLLFNPSGDIPLNTPFKGRIAVHNSNGDDLAIPYSVEVVSEEKGSLKIDAVDEYTYYTDAAPHLQNAHVVIRHPFTGQIMAEGFTNASGIFEVDSLAEGSYKITVEADKHEGYQDVVTIDPGRVNEKTVFLSFQAISYSWEVVPTEIEDNYQVDLVMQYETNVPAPVVIIEMPSEMPQLFNDETYTFLVTLTNKGLITAEDVQLKFPLDDPEYEWVTDYTSTNLLAQQSIQIPVTMRRKEGAPAPAVPQTRPNDRSDITPGMLTESSGPCSDYTVTIYGFECGEDKQFHETSALFSFSGRVCIGTDKGTLPNIDFPTYTIEYGTGPSDPGTEHIIEYDPFEGTPSTLTPVTGCDPCVLSILTTILGCYGGNIGSAIACAYSFADAKVSVLDVAGCLPGIGCAFSVASTALTCYKSPPTFSKYAPTALNLLKASQAMSPTLRQSVRELEYAIDNNKAIRSYISQYMGSLDWQSKENFIDFAAVTDTFVRNKIPIPAGRIDDIKTAMQGTDISEKEIDAFINHWNTSMEAWDKGIETPNSQYPNIINKDSLNSYVDRMTRDRDYALSLGYSSVNDMEYQAMKNIKDEVESERSSVCASVSIKISQKLVMTREAFEGTLTIYNGNETTSMKDIELNLEIRNQNGELANDLFEIQTKALDILTGIDGTGTLGGGQTGSATVLFIPEKGAAPEVPESYSFGGSFSYLDPYTGEKVTKPLFPVTLQVNPSPDLFLHYFMQRNILGDDPLTEPIEPTIPAELAVMIENNGYGTAKNVRIESAQPEIVDNEKGLSIHFELVGSNLNGKPVQLGLTNIDFGNIPPLSTAVGQWWFTSDLLGHFVNYQANVTHLDSRGNPDLSLVSGAKMHELIRSIRVYGPTDDGINDFLVNEYQDANEQPDAIYLSQGQQVLDVNGADVGLFQGNITAPDFTNTLKVISSRLGWNYIQLPDPGKGKYEIVSVTRNSDQQEIPLDNVWLTFVTLPDGKEPVYENKFHFVDKFENTGENDYTVTWKLKEPDPPAVVSIDGTPGSFVSNPVTNVDVKFNKEIDPASFTWEDMTLRLQGGENIMDSSIVISQIDSVTYNVNLSTLTTGNGFYALTVQAAGIRDTNETYGLTGKQVTWTQFLNKPFVEEFVGLPDGVADNAFDYVLIRFNLPVDPNTVTPSRFSFTRNGETVNIPVTITSMDAESKLFKISGLNSLMTTDGLYALNIDLTNIATIDGELGIMQQSVEWKMDTTPPSVLAITPSTEGGFDEQHVTTIDVTFSEEIEGFNLSSVELWKDGSRQPLSQVHIESLGNNLYRLSEFRLLTYYSGNYTLKLDMNSIYDKAGITGTGMEEYQWNVDRSAPTAVENLRINPDLGFSDTDGVTSTRDVNLIMDVMNNNVGIEIYRNDFGSLTLLSDTGNVTAGELSVPLHLPSAGNLELEVHCVDEKGNFSVSKLPVYVDEKVFTASFPNVPSEPVTSQLKTTRVVFTDKILDSSLDVSDFSFQLDGTPITTNGLVLVPNADSSFTVDGLNSLGEENGVYTLSLNLTGVSKYKSGLKGTYTATVSWTIHRPNMAPVADAGQDFNVTPGEQYQLDASGSYDPDHNLLYYEWFPPEGITLDDPYAVNPTFLVPASADTSDYTFLLSVNDGTYISTDKVTAYVLNVSVKNLAGKPGITIYPNPASGSVTISVSDITVKSVSLIDFTGKVMMNRNWTGEKKQTFNLIGVPPGIYIIMIKTNDRVLTRKIVVI